MASTVAMTSSTWQMSLMIPAYWPTHSLKLSHQESFMLSSQALWITLA